MAGSHQAAASRFALYLRCGRNPQPPSLRAQPTVAVIATTVKAVGSNLSLNWGTQALPLRRRKHRAGAYLAADCFVLLRFACGP
ncbi:MAG: hypothetical protein ACREF3_16150, partial [Acetobacteraceae bacterium]